MVFYCYIRGKFNFLASGLSIKNYFIQTSKLWVGRSIRPGRTNLFPFKTKYQSQKTASLTFPHVTFCDLVWTHFFHLITPKLHQATPRGITILSHFVIFCISLLHHGDKEC